ncbi:MAG: T9SS type A sorting domain-containing protein [Calditrichaeota bacterium]|nr:T9SS type A sorting domain-containing protein [Calditrichota bacterium]
MLNLKNMIVICLLLAGTLLADGLLVPSAEQYPKLFLKNRLTQVKVNIHGIIAETQVYQEFVNEWYDSTDAVYSFPLPENAKATEFVYWYNNVPYKAVLKVKEQAVNPGTGEGGIIAEVNEYIGNNGIKIQLKGIAPGSIQKVRLHYIQMCDFFQGKTTYSYPLDTRSFITYPLEHLQFSFYVNSGSLISGFQLPTHDNFKVVSQTDSTLHLEMIEPKAFLDDNLEFSYTTNRDKLGVDFYSIANDSSAGHFALLLRPPNQAQPDSVLNRRFIFVLSNSNTMFGYPLEESISAIGTSLEKLTENDFFNIIVYNNAVSSWKSFPMQATGANILAAKTFLEALSTSYGSQLNLALDKALEQISDADFSNAILIFGDGNSPVDPRQVETANIHKCGIFPLAIGDNANRARLELLADLNYGFTTYIADDDNLKEKVNNVFEQVSQPVLSNVAMEYGRADLSHLIPSKTPTTYAGSYFFTAGRYNNPGESALSIAGNSVSGINFYNFRLDFSSSSSANKFVEYLWAKEMIDQLEHEIEVYDLESTLKDSLVALSLKYNIRCRYTAYIADYETIWPTSVEQDKLVHLPRSFLQGNYPNPFNPSTTIRLYIDTNALGKTIFLKVYNILGQLVTVIDISHFTTGWHNILFNGKDFYGNALPSGVYFVRLQVQNEIHSTIRMNLIK